jgi:hypothetical protein
MSSVSPRTLNININMSTDTPNTASSETATSSRHTSRSVAKSSSARPSSYFTAPEPIRQLFEKVPLITYPANDLPHRSRRQKTQHVLHMFTTAYGARMDSPSFNPSCLKWQVRVGSAEQWLHSLTSGPRLRQSSNFTIFLSSLVLLQIMRRLQVLCHMFCQQILQILYQARSSIRG